MGRSLAISSPHHATPASPSPRPQIRLRLTPEIRFVRDDSIERSERIYKLLDQVGAGVDVCDGCVSFGLGWLGVG